MSVLSPTKALTILAAALMLQSGSSLFAQSSPSGTDVNAARKAEAKDKAEVQSETRETTESAENRTERVERAASPDQETTERRANDDSSRTPSAKDSERSQTNEFRFDKPGESNSQEEQADSGRNNSSQPKASSNQRNDYNDRNNPPPAPDEEDYADHPDSRSERAHDQNDRRFSSQPNDRFDRDNDRFGNDDDRSDRDDRRFGRDDRDSDQGEHQELGAQLMTNDTDQLVVQERHSRGILANANIRQGDIIVSINNQPIHSQQSLWRVIRTYNGRGPIPLVVMRNGSRQTIYVQNVYASNNSGYGHEDYPREYAWDDQESAWLGVYLNARYQNSAVVQSVQDGSAADKAGLRPNDWIVSVNNQRIASPAHLSQVIRDMEPGQEINLEVSRRVTGQLQAKLTDHPNYGNTRRESRDYPERPVNYEDR